MDAENQIVSLHLVSTASVGKLQPKHLPEATAEELKNLPVKEKRQVDYAEDGVHAATIYDGSKLKRGMKFSGPAIVEESGTTVVINPGMEVTVDQLGNLIVDTQGDTKGTKAAKLDPITAEIIQSGLQAAADEMFATMRKTAMSSIIYEVLDMGTGITDKHGEIAGSGAGIPPFVGVLDKAVKYFLNKFPKEKIHDGDIFATNSPYNGGVTHLNDMVLATPVFVDGEIIAWTANIAHWTDIGGKVPGSMSTDATEIFQEGLMLPGIKLANRGEMNESVLDIMKANSRMPDTLEGDLMAGIASLKVGAKRLVQLAEKYSTPIFLEAVKQYMDWGEQLTLSGLKKLPKGKFAVADAEQDDGKKHNCEIEITDTEFIVNLENNPDSSGPFNTSYDATFITAQMVLKNITSPDVLQCTGGNYRPLKLITREGSVFNATYPAAHGFYYEVIVALYDLMWRALAEKLPDLLPAGHFASICATIIGGTHPDTKQPFTVVEPELGGWGGSAASDGNGATYSALHGETYNCPAEICEARYGVFVDKLALSDSTSGHGKKRGGKGVCIEYRMRSEEPAWLTFSYTKSRIPPWGSNGGKAGGSNHIVVVRGDKEETMSEATGVEVKKDEIVRIITANGGGWGNPKDRPSEEVANDVKNGYITAVEAKEVYGYAG
eukprot:TRINITY_DN55643_c0_g1_i1.p1 TRINITY_DN55643_c0_g1~~TRINITY_DN55643_c0_g1_i1.p1  ORF type:complete len:768 (-),score=113.41 TRINITY_DN55643_c0_g1_i1:1308-3296(-)